MDQTARTCCRELLHCSPCIWCFDLIYQCLASTECCKTCVDNPKFYACISPCSAGLLGFDKVYPSNLVGKWASSRKDRKDLGDLFTLTGRSRNDTLALITNERHLQIAPGKGGAFTPVAYVDIDQRGYIKCATITHREEFIYKGQIYDWTNTQWKGSTVCPPQSACFFCCFAVLIPVDSTQANSGILYVNNVALYKRGVKPKEAIKPRSKSRVYDFAGENSPILGEPTTYLTSSFSDTDNVPSSNHSSIQPD